MGQLTNKGKDFMLDSIGGNTPATAAISHVAAHSASPGELGSNELTAGSAPYARVAISFGASSDGTMASDGTDPVFNINAGQTVAFIGFWTSGTIGAGDCQAYDDVTSEVFGADGTYTLTSASFTLS